jgi:Flp pilus assembly CpaE family ATPase
MLDAATRRAIAYCDVLIVAVEPERICLALAQVLLDRIRGLDVAPHDVGIVIVEHSPGDTDYPPEKAEELLGQQVLGVIGAATRLVREAAERGEPLVLLHPESEIAQRIRDLGKTIMT